jgi:hypothetical protein
MAMDHIDAPIGAELVRCRQRVAELRVLNAGWHDGSGEAIDAAAADAAERFLAKRPFLASHYGIYPTDAGGLVFEFETRDWDFSVEFGPGGTVELYGVQLNGSEEMEPQVFESLDEHFIAAFDARVGR